MRPFLIRLAIIAAVFAAALAIACGGGGASPTATLLPPATATPAATATQDAGPPSPQAERIVAHIEFFAGEIGTRLAGSEEEQRAAEYAQQQFESWGYTVELQPFPASGQQLRRASLTLADGSRSFHAVPFAGSGAGSVSGPLIDAGTGRPEEFPPDAQGAVVLVQRRDVTFADMAGRARVAGAAGLIVANKEPGTILAAVPPGTDIPVVVIDQADGEALRALIASGSANVSLQVDPVLEVTAHNVIARPADGRCRTITGGHYDSVPVSAGATDNASGAATVLELARAASVAGLSGHCFMLFGAEEVGLTGSEHFVAQLMTEQKAEIVAMFNYDVTAGAPPPQLIGDEALAQRAAAIARQAGIDTNITVLPSTTSSDYASFLAAGIPSLMFSADDQGIIHTARDSLANVRQDTLQPIADLGFAMMQDVTQSTASASAP